ncbi:Formylglycine-generating enzyme, required for sulfatase activity, contains SUMF1/FGE domain [Flavobacteriaceae bacterium MAR_2010_188]|nr:Formylglycine-generating enzyme, required for sulfatase activity, contains SUMF1/FGE domain [Flavobacteriaceae bacterium MAR_2010_188]
MKFNSNLYNSASFTLLLLLAFNCKEEVKTSKVGEPDIKEYNLIVEKPADVETPVGMVWVPGKTFIQGAKKNDEFAMPREKPEHKVSVDGFFMDATEVTNAQFKKFVDSTKYITVAERAIDWGEMKKTLPANTPKPADSILQPGSLTFNKNFDKVVNMEDYGQWWTWKIGANWKHPAGPESNIEGQDSLPVVHIAYEDAIAYCDWAERRLPTEAEWEAAAQGVATDKIYTWGNDASVLDKNANTWQGNFPLTNESVDGFEYIAPVKSYPPNTLGIYDMLGNVWELTSDLYNEDYYKKLETENTLNPTGAEEHYNPGSPYEIERIIKGGSYLCNASYCASFRISAKMGMSLDSGSDHVGFRTVATPEMLTDVE